jgi:hypothetical protein
LKTEHEEQREFVQWFRQNMGSTRIFAIPNGGARSLSVAGKLKAEGVSRGVPDLYVPRFNLWIEMKRVKGGVVSSDQKSWHEYLRHIGHTVLLTKGCEDAIKQVEEFMEEVG